MDSFLMHHVIAFKVYEYLYKSKTFQNQVI